MKSNQTNDVKQTKIHGFLTGFHWLDYVSYVDDKVPNSSESIESNTVTTFNVF